MNGTSETTVILDQQSNQDKMQNGVKNESGFGHNKVPPTIRAMVELAEENVASFQFPGHNKGLAAPPSMIQFIGQSSFLYDDAVFDNLSSVGPLAEAQKLAAEVFGASETRFLVGGTTSGIQAAILGTCRPGDVLLLSRNCHQSVMSGIVLSGVVPKYIFPDYDSNWDMATTMSPLEVEKAIKKLEKEGRKPAAVIITSPTYQGVCSNVKEISTVCHTHHIPLIVDEAHGAHFGFHPKTPASALYQGADVVLQSTHKVLLSLTQASMLHIQGNLVDRDKIRRSLQTLQSTSPNSLLYASLDATTVQLSINPIAVLNDAIDFTIDARLRIQQIPGLSVYEFPALDPFRLTVGLHDLGITGYEAYDLMLKDHGVGAGMLGPRSITFIFTPGTTREHVDKLVLGLNRVSSSLLLNPKKTQKGGCSEPFIDIDMKMALTPREAFFAKKTKIKMNDSIGKISGELICPYPPGIPVVIPGEVITEKALDFLAEAKADGARIIGASDPLLSTILVCDDPMEGLEVKLKNSL